MENIPQLNQSSVGSSSASSSRALWPNTQIQSCDLSDYKTLSLKLRPHCCPTSLEFIIWGQSGGILHCSVYLGDKWKVCGKPQRVDYILGWGDSKSKLQQTGTSGSNFPFKLGGCVRHSCWKLRPAVTTRPESHNISGCFHSNTTPSCFTLCFTD